MSGLHAREPEKIDLSHPLRAVVALLVGALIPPTAVLAATDHATVDQARPASVTVPDRPSTEVA
ncbi:hypothetical protein ACH4U6_35045 [Streptomyces netropsis]|uniref:hypothetical protein n=1 Tax=Streptomyces netropsis TaxID=55404 RepID=UPI0037B30C2F